MARTKSAFFRAAALMQTKEGIYTMRTKTLWLWLPLLVTSLALVAAGCGGDDNEAAGTGATKAAPRPPSR